MEPALLPGLGTAIVTPFHSDGSIDHASLKRLVEAQCAAGVDFLVACGSTGEASTLSEDETGEVVAAVVQASAGRLPVIVGCTHNSTREAARRAARLAQLPGVAAILSANPYYNKPTQQGQYLHFKAIAEAIGKTPLLLYNIPGRTAANMDPATIVRLAGLPNVVGVKESSGNLTQIGEVIATVPAGFAVFAGDDHLALPVIASGGVGLISVASNVAPREVAEVVRAARAQNMPAAREAAERVQALNAVLFAEPNPAPTKALLAMMQVIEGDTLRLPMIPVSDATREKLRVVAERMQLIG